MARYYLGKYVNQVFEPIHLEGIGTSIREVIDFTTGFVGEMELRNYLLEEGLISFWDVELAYVRERGVKDHYHYTPIPLGNNICTITEKKFFDLVRIREYCCANCYNSELFLNMAAYYIRKLKINQLLEKKIKEFSTDKGTFKLFLETLFGFNGNIPSLARKVLVQFEQASDEEKEYLLEELVRELLTDNKSLVRLFELYNYTLEINYTRVVERIIGIYDTIYSRTSVGNLLESDINYIKYLIGELLRMMIYCYDPKIKGYVCDEAGYVLNERGLVDLGLFLAVHHDYEREYPESRETLVEDERPEHFLDEDDFKRLHSSAEREGFYLRKKDKDQ